MAADRRRLAVLAALALVVIEARAAESIAPGVRRVCVPAEDGRTWECGTSDKPPPQRALAPRDSPPPPSFLAAPGAATIVPLEEAPAASAEPIRPRTDDFPDAPQRDASSAVVEGGTVPEAAAPADLESPEQPAEAVAEVPVESPAGTIADTPEETPSEPSVAASEAGGEPASEAPVFLAAPPRRGLSPGPPIEASPPPTQDATPATEPHSADAVAQDDPLDAVPEQPVEPADPEPTTVADATPEAAADPVGGASAPIGARPTNEERPSREASSDPALEPAPEAAPEPSATEVPPSPAETPAGIEAPADAAPSADTTPRGREEFLALSGTAYTVQLAHGRDASGFPALLASLGLDGSDAYAVPFDRDGARWWMLNWSSFPDAASARAALARLPRGEGVNVGYPRRIGLIQNELRK